MAFPFNQKKEKSQPQKQIPPYRWEENKRKSCQKLNEKQQQGENNSLYFISIATVYVWSKSTINKISQPLISRNL